MLDLEPRTRTQISGFRVYDCHRSSVIVPLRQLVQTLRYLSIYLIRFGSDIVRLENIVLIYPTGLVRTYAFLRHCEILAMSG